MQSETTKRNPDLEADKHGLRIFGKPGVY